MASVRAAMDKSSVFYQDAPLWTAPSTPDSPWVVVIEPTLLGNGPDSPKVVALRPRGFDRHVIALGDPKSIVVHSHCEASVDELRNLAEQIAAMLEDMRRAGRSEQRALDRSRDHMQEPA